MTEPTDCLCGGGKDGTPRMDIVCPVHDADPTLLDSEIRQKLEMLEVPKMIFWVDKEMKVEKTKLTDKTIDEILALIATTVNEVIGQDSVQKPNNEDYDDYTVCDTCDVIIDPELQTYECNCILRNQLRAEQRAKLQELIK